jgi:hypothetical protein
MTPDPPLEGYGGVSIPLLFIIIIYYLLLLFWGIYLGTSLGMLGTLCLDSPEVHVSRF